MEITLCLSTCKRAHYRTVPPRSYHFCYLLLRAKSSPVTEEPVGKATWLLPVVLYTSFNLTSFSASHAFFEMPSGLSDWEHHATPDHYCHARWYHHFTDTLSVETEYNNFSIFLWSFSSPQLPADSYTSCIQPVGCTWTRTHAKTSFTGTVQQDTVGVCPWSHCVSQARGEMWQPAEKADFLPVF